MHLSTLKLHSTYNILPISSPNSLIRNIFIDLKRTYQGLMYLGQVAAVTVDREYYQRPAIGRHRSLRRHKTAMSSAAAVNKNKNIYKIQI